MQPLLCAVVSSPPLLATRRSWLSCGCCAAGWGCAGPLALVRPGLPTVCACRQQQCVSTCNVGCRYAPGIRFGAASRHMQVVAVLRMLGSLLGLCRAPGPCVPRLASRLCLRAAADARCSQDQGAETRCWDQDKAADCNLWPCCQRALVTHHTLVVESANRLLSLLHQQEKGHGLIGWLGLTANARAAYLRAALRQRVPQKPTRGKLSACTRSPRPPPASYRGECPLLSDHLIT